MKNIGNFEKAQVENDISFPSIEVSSFEAKMLVEMSNALNRLLHNRFYC
jgi:hypothetical protein